MRDRPDIEIIDVTDEGTFDRLPVCADGRFDHRSCDYWEDEVRGVKSARPSWWQETPGPATAAAPGPADANPFVPARDRLDVLNPFAPNAIAAGLDPLGGDDLVATPAFNPFAPTPARDPHLGVSVPRKLRMLDRGRAVFGSYAKVLFLDSVPAAYAQFGPLSAYPRARHIRDLYPRLPQSPLPAVITCVATTAAARGRGLGRELVRAIAVDLAARGFAAIEAYPDLTLQADESSAASPGFWERCGFALAVADKRYPVMRIELD